MDDFEEEKEEMMNRLNIGLGEKTEREAEDFLKKVTDVSAMLADLTSRDSDKVRQAEDDIDEFLEKEETKKEEEEKRKRSTAGCLTVQDKTVINDKVFKTDITICPC